MEMFIFASHLLPVSFGIQKKQLFCERASHPFQNMRRTLLWEIVLWITDCPENSVCQSASLFFTYDSVCLGTELARGVVILTREIKRLFKKHAPKLNETLMRQGSGRPIRRYLFFSIFVLPPCDFKQFWREKTKGKRNKKVHMRDSSPVPPNPCRNWAMFFPPRVRRALKEPVPLYRGSDGLNTA